MLGTEGLPCALCVLQFPALASHVARPRTQCVWKCISSCTAGATGVIRICRLTTAPALKPVAPVEVVSILFCS